MTLFALYAKTKAAIAPSTRQSILFTSISSPVIIGDNPPIPVPLMNKFDTP